MAEKRRWVRIDDEISFVDDDADWDDISGLSTAPRRWWQRAIARIVRLRRG